MLTAVIILSILVVLQALTIHTMEGRIKTLAAGKRQLREQIRTMRSVLSLNGITLSTSTDASRPRFDHREMGV